jgi:hypothetical protein
VQGEGDHPPLERRRSWSGKGEGLHKRSAEAWGDSLRARGGSAPIGGLSTAWCASAHRIYRVALRQEQAAEEGGGRRGTRLETGEERSSSLERNQRETEGMRKSFSNSGCPP